MGLLQKAVTVRVKGIPQLAQNLKGLKDELLEEADAHATREAGLLYEHTGRIVPYLDGILLGSRYQKRDEASSKRFPRWQVGYDLGQAPYAWEVHQVPANHPTRGPYNDPKTDHFLSIPRDLLAQTYAARAQVKLNAVVRSFRVRRTK